MKTFLDDGFQRKVLEMVLKAGIHTDQKDVQPLQVKEESMEWSLNHEEHIKEEDEEEVVSKFSFNPVTTKTEEEEEKVSRLHQGEDESSTSSAQHTKAEDDGGPEPSNSLDPFLRAEHQRWLSTGSDTDDTDDSEDWRETSNPQVISDSLEKPEISQKSAEAENDSLSRLSCEKPHSSKSDVDLHKSLCSKVGSPCGSITEKTSNTGKNGYSHIERNLSSKLITTVSCFPILYDASHGQNKKDLVWKKVSKIVGIPDESCRKRWKSLMETYLSEKKKETENRRRGTKGSKWRYLADLSFLDPFLSSRGASGYMEGRYKESAASSPDPEVPAAAENAEETPEETRRRISLPANHEQDFRSKFTSKTLPTKPVQEVTAQQAPKKSENLEKKYMENMNAAMFYDERTPVETRVPPAESEDSCLSESGDSDEEYIPAQAGDSSSSEESFIEEDDDEPPSVATPARTKRQRVERKPVKRNSHKEVPVLKADLPDTDAVKLPIDYFRDFFDVELLDFIVEQSNLYFTQKKPNCALKLDKDELEQFIGTVIYMSVLRLPRPRMYWSSACRLPHVADVMTRDRWEEIKHHIHFNDNMAPSNDRLFKIRPLIDSLLPKCQALPQEQMLCVDEQMVPFKGKSCLKQYIPRKLIKKMAVECPSIISLFNKFMGGVDALDALVAYYHIHIRSKKYYHRFFFHLVDMVIVNGWLLYRRDSESLSIPKKKQKDFLSFRTSVAQALCMQVKDLSKKKRGRPSSNLEREFEKKKHRGPTKAIPPQEVRGDAVGHWPVVESTRQRCKLPNCRGQTVFKCSKCNVHLCLNKNNNCFREFHE